MALTSEDCIWIGAPLGRDARLLQALLTQAGLVCAVIQAGTPLTFDQGIGALLLTEEALGPALLQALQAGLDPEPEWSNVPIVLLVDPATRLHARALITAALGASKSITVLERPVPPKLLLEVMQAVFQMRQRQYQVRALLTQLAQQNTSLAQEVAERKQAEAALHALNATLEQQVQQRTAELTQRLRELDEFAYVTSHDLKAPLRAIDHLAHWISEDAGPLLPPASLDHLEKLRGRIRRMEKLLEDLLHYSRANRYPYRAERVDVAQLLDEIVRLVTPPEGFAIHVLTPLPTVVTQKVPLETVLRNLIENAIKHHDRWDGQVQVAVQELGEWLEFSVQDDGPGIALQFHERIFQLFQTLKPRDTVEGSGMGLAIVKKLIESRGGHITVESQVGQGTTFRFTWPKG